jgi:hypothetical protein
MATVRTKRLKRKTKTNKEYLDYVSKYNKRTGTDRQPMTRYHWERSGRRTSYGGATGSTTATAHLRRKERKAIGMKD